MQYMWWEGLMEVQVWGHESQTISFFNPQSEKNKAGI